MQEGYTVATDRFSQAAMYVSSHWRIYTLYRRHSHAAIKACSSTTDQSTLLTEMNQKHTQ